MSPLYTDLDATDASAIVDELAGRGVQYELTDAGHTVLVPSTRRLRPAGRDGGQGLPSSNDGYALLDKQGITTSEFRQRIDYQRALEGELSNTLQAMDGVDAATVHLALPEESVFVDEAGNPTASVLVETAGLTELGGDQVDAIVHLVASVGEEHATGRRHRHRCGRARCCRPAARGRHERRRRTHLGRDRASSTNWRPSLTSMVARGHGPGQVAVTVERRPRPSTAAVDVRESTSQAAAPTAPGRSSPDGRSTETYTDAAAVAGDAGVLGPDGAVVTPTRPPPRRPAPTTTRRSTAESTYALDKVVEQVIEAPGAVERLNVAVLIDEASVTDAQVTEIELDGRGRFRHRRRARRRRGRHPAPVRHHGGRHGGRPTRRRPPPSRPRPTRWR